MPNIFDLIPDDGSVVPANPPQKTPNIFDIIPATSNVFDGLPINSGNAQLAGDQFLANILHPPIINPALGVHQPGMFSSGFSIQPPSLQNADDWGFTAAILPKVLNNAITRTIGTGLNAAGQALKGDAEAALFQITGQPEAANQELISTAAKMMPSEAAKDQQLGIDTSDPYEDARQTLPVAERIASGIGPGLIQTAPQMALTAVQPELGAASFGFTPEGFDPVQAAAMMIAPAGGKMIGGITENLAAKAGITSKQALGLINRVGGGTGVASLISAPTAYQIAQMKPGPERDNAIQDAASSAIIAGILGGMGEHSVPDERVLTTDDVAQHAVPGPNGEENVPVQAGPAKQQPQKPDSEELDGLAAGLKDLQNMLRRILPPQAQQVANEPTGQADQIDRSVFRAEEQPVEATDETLTDGISQPARGTTVPSAPIRSEISPTKNILGLATATPAASKPYYVYSTDGIGGIGHQATQAGVQNYLRRQNNVPEVQIVNDPTWTHNGYGVRGTVQDGKIIVNRAFIDSADTLQKVLREEHNHVLLSSKAGRQIIRDGLGNKLGIAQLAGLAPRYPIQPGESVPDYTARLTDEFIAKAGSQELPVWQQIVERVKAWLADKGIGELSDEETARAIIRALKSDKVASSTSKGLAPFHASDSAIDEPTEENSDRAARYNLTEEPTEGMSVRRTAKAINQFFGTKQLPRRIRVIRNRTDSNDVTIHPETIVVNTAQISTPEQAQDVVVRGGLRGVWYHPEVQKAWQYVRSTVTPKEMTAEFNRRKAQGLPTDTPTIRDEAATVRVMNSDGRNGVVGGFHNAIRTALKQRFEIDVPETAKPQLRDAVIKFLRDRNKSQRKTTSGVPVGNAAGFSSASNIPTIRGRIPINSRYAGQTHPSGIKFTSQGFPDFSPYARLQVKVKGLAGDYITDEDIANKAAGLQETPDGYVWHHVQDGKTMQLIPKNIHGTRHTGGAARIRNRGFDK